MYQQQVYFYRSDVEGKYETFYSTICKYKGSLLESVITKKSFDYYSVKCDKDGYIFIDRDGEIFKIILNSMRYGKLVIPFNFSDYDLLTNEIDYYKLPFKIPKLKVENCRFNTQRYYKNP